MQISPGNVQVCPFLESEKLVLHFQVMKVNRFDVDALSGISISRQNKQGVASSQNPAQICLDKDAIKLGSVC